jgi:leader peptidase (prepilin peptidase)/N-methyltransferase
LNILDTIESSWLGPVFTFAFGLILGSFVNVVIYRLPRGKSIVFPSSACPACGKDIAPYDNVPILSYMMLRGRCRHCRTVISVRYPFVELVVGLASLAAYFRQGLGLEYLCELGFVAAMVALVFIDYDHRVLPNAITVPGAVLGLLLAWPRETVTVKDSLVGALLGAGLLFLVAEVYLRVRKIEGLGMGDVKMMGMVGAFLGWKGVLLTLFLGSLLGTLVGLIVMAHQRKGLKTALPFGTFLGITAVAAQFVGPPLIDWYTGLF